VKNIYVEDILIKEQLIILLVKLKRMNIYLIKLEKKSFKRNFKDNNEMKSKFKTEMKK